MKVKVTRNEIRECVSNAVYRLLRESYNLEDNLDSVEANDKEWASEDDDYVDDEEEPTMNDINTSDEDFDDNDDLIKQAMMRNSEKPLQSKAVTFSTDLNCEDEVDCQIMDELEAYFNAEIDGDDDYVTVTVDSSMIDGLKDYFREHQIQASESNGLVNESRIKQIIRENIRKTLKTL